MKRFELVESKDTSVGINEALYVCTDCGDYIEESDRENHIDDGICRKNRLENGEHKQSKHI